MWKQQNNQKDSVLKNLKSIKSLTNLSNLESQSTICTIASKNFEKYDLIVHQRDIEQEVAFISWRSKTELPIVKVLFYKFLNKQPQQQFSHVQISIEIFPRSLETLPKLPLFQILYLLKEAAIGFERLYQKVGTFVITEKMIMVNKNHMCRVWMNEQLPVNRPSKVLKMKESEFLFQIVRLIEQKCIMSNHSIDLFRLVNVQDLSFLKIIQIIEKFAKENKILISNRLDIASQSANLKSPDNGKEKPENNLQRRGTIFQSSKRIPKFIAKLQEEKSNNLPLTEIQQIRERKSEDSPSKKQSIFRDYSQDNIFEAKKKVVRKLIQKDHSYSSNYSSISPKAVSQISRTALFKTAKSNNTRSKLLKKISLEFNPSLILQEQETPQIQMSSFQTAENLFFTKFPVTSNQQKKNRKLSSNNENQMKIETREQKKFPFFCQTPQTKTIHEKSTNNEKNVQLGNINEGFETDIYQKNGWKNQKLDDFLKSDAEIRASLKSNIDGNDQFSEDFMMTYCQLSQLSKIGGKLSESINNPD